MHDQVFFQIELQNVCSTKEARMGEDVLLQQGSMTSC